MYRSLPSCNSKTDKPQSISLDNGPGKWLTRWGVCFRYIIAIASNAALLLSLVVTSDNRWFNMPVENKTEDWSKLPQITAPSS